jgi:uncharacterized membrane protein
MNNKVMKIAMGGVLSAVIMLATVAFPIPLPNHMGFINFGDGVIFGVSAILGPFAAIAAALGSALSDYLLGYAVYIPATAVIKGSMGLLAGLVLRRFPKLPWYLMIALFAVCELIMVGGYFLYESLIYGVSAAVVTVPGNLMQGLAGIILGLAIVPLVRKVKSLINF